MASKTAFELRHKIYGLLSTQRLFRRSARQAAESFQVKDLELDEAIRVFEKEMRDAQFVEYCNTSCWKYKC